MVFRMCSIGGKAYRGDPRLTEEDEEDDIVLEKDIPKVRSKTDIRLSAAQESTSSASAQELGIPNPQSAPGVKLAEGVLLHFSDATLSQDLEESLHAAPGSENSLHARALNGFFNVLALCHSVLTTVDPETGAIEYKAQSPDEAALVQAAADVGYIFRGRDKEILSLQTPFSDELDRYELLNILEFTSYRKRMSVVLRKLDDEDGRIFLLSKGADNVIFERLKAGSDELKAETERHLDEFAGEGLRTLTLAYKVVNGTYS